MYISVISFQYLDKYSQDSGQIERNSFSELATKRYIKNVQRNRTIPLKLMPWSLDFWYPYFRAFSSMYPLLSSHIVRHLSACPQNLEHVI